MKKYLVFSGLFFWAVYYSVGQSSFSYQFSYDNAGNLIKRECAVKVVAMVKSPVFDSLPHDSIGDEKVTIMPNPTQGMVTIQITPFNNSLPCQWNLFDYNGQLILTNTSKTDAFNIDLTNKPAGFYLLQIIHGQQTSKWKIIKEN